MFWNDIRLAAGCRTDCPLSFLGRRGSLMMKVLDSVSSGFEPCRGHCVVFLGKTFYSHGGGSPPLSCDGLSNSLTCFNLLSEEKIQLRTCRLRCLYYPGFCNKKRLRIAWNASSWYIQRNTCSRVLTGFPRLFT